MIGVPTFSTDTDAAQAAADHATYVAQHEAALRAIAARQVGDTSAYAQAIQDLYGLGIANAASATNADLQAIADSASTQGFLSGITGAAKWVALGLGAWFLVTAVGPLLRSTKR